ncbi:MAG: response regulator, partial [Holophagales bacterium]|nr:response regulator [Holophagales bacterium]
DGIAVADLDGNMQFINEAWANLHGYEVFELLGYDLTIFHTDEQMREQVLPLLEKVAEEGAHSAEIEHRKRGGGTFPTWQTATCLLDPDGDPSGFVFIVRDITERKAQEEERRRLEEKVRQAEKLESLGSLAGGIAHDYNNILTGVLGNVSLALQEADAGSDLLQRLRQIEASAERAAELTDQLLAYAGEEQPLSRVLQLNDLVQEHRPSLERAVARSNARLEVHLKSGLPPMQGDPNQVLLAITNLLANAADSLEDADPGGLIMLRTSVVAAKRGYFEGAVLDTTKPEGRYVFFEVSDTGVGMDEETRARMFEPFYSTKSSGRGMGLAAVLGIVRAHQGNIRVFSQLGRGTTVEVLFPALEEASSGRDDGPSVQTWEGYGTALVVDDEQLVRDVAAKVLQRQGFEVLTANNGREALDIVLARQDEIRLVLLDLTMPEMDGETFMREMRRFESDVKILLMSGYREASATQGLDGAQLAGFLHKPFRPNELLRKVREILS